MTRNNLQKYSFVLTMISESDCQVIKDGKNYGWKQWHCNLRFRLPVRAQSLTFVRLHNELINS